MSRELYKQHRPRALRAVIGNEETVGTLLCMIETNTLPHTIMFSGPSGCGKTTLARILRDMLDCGPMDFKELNCSDFRGIDTIREIARTMTLAPVGGACRIFLLDEVHQLSRDGQHASLKILEDTPNHVYFFLCTTDPHKLLKTILTRCCHLPVRLLRDEELVKLLKRVAKKEKLKLSKDIIDDIANFADGSARQALVLLDRIRHVPRKKQAKALAQKAGEKTQAIDLCRALIKHRPWNEITAILRDLKDDPESTRWAVLGYARAVMLSKPNPTAYDIICAFENHFYDSKAPGLIRACYEVRFGEEPPF